MKQKLKFIGYEYTKGNADKFWDYIFNKVIEKRIKKLSKVERIPIEL